MLTPLRCILVLAQRIKMGVESQASYLNSIIDSSFLLLGQIKSNLDCNLMDQNIFTPNLTLMRLVRDVIEPVVKLFKVQLESLQI